MPCPRAQVSWKTWGSHVFQGTCVRWQGTKSDWKQGRDSGNKGLFYLQKNNRKCWRFPNREYILLDVRQRTRHFNCREKFYIAEGLELVEKMQNDKLNCWTRYHTKATQFTYMLGFMGAFHCWKRCGLKIFGVKWEARISGEMESSLIFWKLAEKISLPCTFVALFTFTLLPIPVTVRFRPQKPRSSFWSASWIASSGPVQHRKSAIYGLHVKSDWL